MTDIDNGLARFIRSPGFKFFAIGALVFVLLVPLLLVWGLVQERQSRAGEVEHEIASLWGGRQAVNGPMLAIPYTARVTVRRGEAEQTELVRRSVVVMPDALSIAAETTTQALSRGIYKVNAYTAVARLEGRFTAPQLAAVVPDAAEIHWGEAVLAVGLSDVSGLKSTSPLRLDGNGREIGFEPSIGIPGQQVAGIHAPVGPAIVAPDGSGLGAFDFSLALDFAGSSELTFTPVARRTEVAVASDWPHPSFSGAFLPADRAIDETGFKARWTVPHLARSVPQAWGLGGSNLDQLVRYGFGVRFYTPVDFYGLVERATKYGGLFVLIAFMATFVMELSGSRRVHPVQYVFVGIAMVFFYVLLLSLAEHLGFAVAYIVASLATGGMLSLYVGKALGSFAKGLSMLAIFAALYCLLYLILRLEDYALLAGSIMGFVMLSAVMFKTLQVDWSGQSAPPAPQSASA